MINLNHAKRLEWTQRHGKVILLHDTTKVAKETLKELNWDVTSSTVFLDIAHFDYHLFWLMGYRLAEQHFDNFKEVKKWVDS